MRRYAVTFSIVGSTVPLPPREVKRFWFRRRAEKYAAYFRRVAWEDTHTLVDTKVEEV